jgi:hypothetical protein
VLSSSTSVRASLLLLLLFQVACSGADLPTRGPLGVPAPAHFEDGVLFVDAALDGHPGARLLVDTGAPYTILIPGAFPGATVPPDSQVSADITLGALTVEGVPAVSYESGARLLGGLLGGNVLRQFSVQLDDRAQTLRLGDGEPPADVEQPGDTVGFDLVGGGRYSPFSGLTIQEVPTRVIISVVVEGTAHWFLLDTGASDVDVRQSLFDQLTSDGRPQRGDFQVFGSTGVRMAHITRAHDIQVDHQSVQNPAVFTDGDDLLDGVSREAGRPVDGLLGGSFLAEFLITVDYPRRQLTLQRFGTRDHVVDELKRVGLRLGAPTADGRGYTVGSVYGGTDAQAKGLAPGDEVLSIDGEALGALSPNAADDRLDGVVGATHQLTLGQTAVPALAQTTLAVRVDDLVPVN